MRGDLKSWLSSLRNDIGFDGWRLDFAKVKPPDFRRVLPAAAAAAAAFRLSADDAEVPE